VLDVMTTTLTAGVTEYLLAVDDVMENPVRL
jgi:hypothetical protein